MSTQRRRQIFAQRRRAALDPSGAAGSGPAATTPPPPPVSRIVPLCPGSNIMVEIDEPVLTKQEEEARALIWTMPVFEEDEFRGPQIDLGSLHHDDGTRQNIEVPAPVEAQPQKRKTLRLRKGR